MGLLRVLSNPHTLQKNPLSVEQAWQTYLSWRKQRAVSYLREPGGYDALMARYLVAGLVNRRAWTDAHLAATAQAAKMRIVTFDSDFKRFRDLSILHLTD
jgi:predicted nucleic acid-binding protein